MEETENIPLNREDKILTELKQLRRLFTVLLGTEDQPTKEKFSRTAITKAAREYRKMQAERGEWVASGDVDDIIKMPHIIRRRCSLKSFRLKIISNEAALTILRRKT